MVGKSILVILLTVTTIIVSDLHLYGQTSKERIELSSTQTEIVVYEPLNLEITYYAPSDRQPLFELMVNGEVIDRSLIESKGSGGLNLPKKTVFRQEGETYIWQTHALLVLNALRTKERKWIFDRAGKYTVKLSEKNSNTDSNTLTIDVREPTERENECLKLFIGDVDVIRGLIEIGRVTYDKVKLKEETISNLDKIVKEYVDTPFASYAAHILGVKKNKEITMAGKPWGEMTKEIQETIPYFLPAVKVEKSRLQEEALFMIQNLYFMLDDNPKGGEFYRQLITKYPNGAYAGQAKTDYERMKKFEK